MLGDIDCVEKAIIFRKAGADVITPDVNINRDLGLLKRIREKTGADIKLMVNEGCLFRCPFRKFHFNYISHKSRNPGAGKGVKSEDNVFSLNCIQLSKNDPSQLLKSGWIRPEDARQYGEITGYFKIVGRLKDMVIRGGENISPGEIENAVRSGVVAMLEHPLENDRHRLHAVLHVLRVAIGIGGIKDGTNQVKGRKGGGPGVENPKANTLAGVGRERRVLVLVGITVKDHIIGHARSARLAAVGVAQAVGSLFQIDFALDKHIFLRHRFELRRRNDDCAAAVTPDADEQSRSILIIEDDAEELQHVRELLAGSGFNTISAALNSNIADLLEGKPVKAVVVGMNKGNEREFSICTRINTVCERYSLPIIMSASQWTRTGVLKAVKHGARGILIKPYNADELLEKLGKFLDAA